MYFLPDAFWKIGNLILYRLLKLVRLKVTTRKKENADKYLMKKMRFVDFIYLFRLRFIANISKHFGARLRCIRKQTIRISIRSIQLRNGARVKICVFDLPFSPELFTRYI